MKDAIYFHEQIALQNAWVLINLYLEKKINKLRAENVELKSKQPSSHLEVAIKTLEHLKVEL